MLTINRKCVKVRPPAKIWLFTNTYIYIKWGDKPRRVTLRSQETATAPRQRSAYSRSRIFVEFNPERIAARWIMSRLSSSALASSRILFSNKGMLLPLTITAAAVFLTYLYNRLRFARLRQYATLPQMTPSVPWGQFKICRPIYSLWERERTSRQVDLGP